MPHSQPKHRDIYGGRLTDRWIGASHGVVPLDAQVRNCEAVENLRAYLSLLAGRIEELGNDKRTSRVRKAIEAAFDDDVECG